MYEALFTVHAHFQKFIYFQTIPLHPIHSTPCQGCGHPCTCPACLLLCEAHIWVVSTPCVSLHTVPPSLFQHMSGRKKSSKFLGNLLSSKPKFILPFQSSSSVNLFSMLRSNHMMQFIPNRFEWIPTTFTELSSSFLDPLPGTL